MNETSNIKSMALPSSLIVGNRKLNALDFEVQRVRESVSTIAQAAIAQFGENIKLVKMNQNDVDVRIIRPFYQFDSIEKLDTTDEKVQKAVGSLGDVVMEKGLGEMVPPPSCKETCL